MGDALDDPEPGFTISPVRLAKMRSIGRKHVFVNCGNPGCGNPGRYHNTELDVSRFQDGVTFNDLQPRTLCTACDHRGADAGHPDHLKVFANPVAADEWFKANDPKGAAFEYDVLE
jgi:hypothetical protein